MSDWSLRVIDGPLKGQQFPLVDGIIRIGRDTSNQICLPDSEASRKHVEITGDGRQFQLKDLNSANGVFTESAKVTDLLLQNGQKFRIGQTWFEVLNSQPSENDLQTRIRHRVGSRAVSPALAAFPQNQRLDRKYLETFWSTARASSRISDREELVAEWLRLVNQALTPRQASIWLKSKSGDWKLLSQYPAADTSAIRFSESIANLVLAQKEGFLIEDATGDDRFARQASVARYQLQEVLCVPLEARHEVFGVLFILSNANSQDQPAYTADDLKLAVSLGHQIALAWEDMHLREALLQTERLAAIGTTISAISHSIKNILQGLAFGGDMIREAIQSNDMPMIQRGWTLVEKNQNRIRDLVMDMLRYSKKREPMRERGQITLILSEIVELTGKQAEEAGVKLLWQPPMNIPAFDFDMEAVHAAILNIINNAIDAVSEHGGGTVKVSCTVTENEVQVQVCDDGPGIPKDQHESIFQPFVSSKGGKGTGLGLPISRKVAEEHGGRLILQSEPGQGASFVFHFPVIQISQSSSVE